MTPDFLRTPEDRFDNLAGWPYAPSYVDDLPGYQGLRMAYVDEGPRSVAREDAPVALCLHGEPSWGYLYRRMIPVFLEAGMRVVVPDLFGFGRSDKPTDRTLFTYSWHRQSLLNLVERLDLRRITLVCQDWGGVLGLTLPMEAATRYERLIVMNTSLPLEPGAGMIAADVFSGKEPETGFGRWRKMAAEATDLPIGALVRRMAGSAVEMTDAEVAAYDAPFPDASYKAAALAFPLLVPLRPDMDGYAIGQRAAQFWNRWSGQSFMAIGPEDKVIPPAAMHRLRDEIRNCPEPYIVEGASHFVQERGDEVARAALDHFARAAEDG